MKLVTMFPILFLLLTSCGKKSGEQHHPIDLKAQEIKKEQQKIEATTTLNSWPKFLLNSKITIQFLGFNNHQEYTTNEFEISYKPSQWKNEIVNQTFENQFIVPSLKELEENSQIKKINKDFLWDQLNGNWAFVPNRNDYYNQEWNQWDSPFISKNQKKMLEIKKIIIRLRFSATSEDTTLTEFQKIDGNIQLFNQIHPWQWNRKNNQNTISAEWMADSSTSEYIDFLSNNYFRAILHISKWTYNSDPQSTYSPTQTDGFPRNSEYQPILIITEGNESLNWIPQKYLNDESLHSLFNLDQYSYLSFQWLAGQNYDLNITDSSNQKLLSLLASNDPFNFYNRSTPIEPYNRVYERSNNLDEVDHPKSNEVSGVIISSDLINYNIQTLKSKNKNPNEIGCVWNYLQPKNVTRTSSLDMEKFLQVIRINGKPLSYWWKDTIWGYPTMEGKEIKNIRLAWDKNFQINKIEILGLDEFITNDISKKNNCQKEQQDKKNRKIDWTLTKLPMVKHEYYKFTWLQ